MKVPDWIRIQEFFFTAMISGYAKSSLPAVGMYMPGYNSLTYSSGDLMLIDQWATYKSSDRSSGSTTIYKDNQPIWVMSYEGHYPEDALPTLKAALHINYKKKVFLGGRGPAIVNIAGYHYSNQIGNNEFTDFDGAEYIHRGQLYVGSHSYRGQSLV